MSAQFIINLIFIFQILFLAWQAWDRGKKLAKIFGEIESELSQTQRKVKELEKQIEFLKSESSQ